MSTVKGLYRPNVTIANGQTTSNVADTGGAPLAGIYAPASMTGASLRFQAAITGDGTFSDVRDRFGNNITVTLNAAGSFHSLTDSLLFGADFIRVISSSAEGAERVLTLVFQQVID